MLLVELDSFFLRSNGNPNTVTWHNCRGFWKMLLLHTMHQWFYLVHEVINRTETDGTSELTVPSLFDGSQTLPQAAAKKGILLQIDPKPLILLQESKGTKHIVMVALARQQRDVQVLNVTISGFQIPFIMPISRELIGILASTISTGPVTCSLITPDSAWLSFFSFQLCHYMPSNRLSAPV